MQQEQIIPGFSMKSVVSQGYVNPEKLTRRILASYTRDSTEQFEGFLYLRSSTFKILEGLGPNPVLLESVHRDEKMKIFLGYVFNHEHVFDLAKLAGPVKHATMVEYLMNIPPNRIIFQ